MCAEVWYVGSSKGWSWQRILPDIVHAREESGKEIQYKQKPLPPDTIETGVYNIIIIITH